MPRRPDRPAESSASPSVKMICPSPEELSIINNNVKCEQCGLVFRNEPRYRLHDLKVHQHKKLDKIAKENARYYCPIQSCVYAVNSQRYFSTMKYLKQHYLKVHAEKNYACDRCGKSFSTESAKNGHTRVCGIEFTCSCLKTYVTYEALLTHAKRSLHTITENYKNSRHTNSKTTQIILPRKIISKPVSILPNPEKSGKNSENINTIKSTSDVGVQTDDYKRSKRPSPLKLNNNNLHNTKRRISQQTQTNHFSKEKTSGKSIETQTPQANRELPKINKRSGKCRALSKQSEQTLLKEDLDLGNNFASTNLFPASPLPLRHDVGLQDFWEQKNTSGTQTIPEKDIFEAFNDSVTQTEFDTFYNHSHNPLIQCVPKSTVALMTLPYVEDTSAVEGYSFASTDGMSQADLMLTTKTFEDRFSSIETQTEQAFSPSYFYSESFGSKSFALSSNIETQTTDNLDNMEQLLYSNTYTQTCDKMLSSDLGLSNIQTQTAWSHNDTTVSTETQTKSLICGTDCNIPTGACRSWLNTQTSHTETQTDLLSIFEGLE
ncbi:PREDICTED: protein indeterminate-domain 9 [Trachymyrmex cornetzi]|uniref:ATM interactor n=1 Tax=Trachymyrmex cornetzi TaxID=471704 RepID=A0A151J7B7_9HYME|nr:PREDICTED: protein indeterminate-domain 9 [Trachymyrmex cornetzi]KYN19728.1 ATM interactor [Trachymyrmex cornetzi]